VGEWQRVLEERVDDHISDLIWGRQVVLLAELFQVRYPLEGVEDCQGQDRMANPAECTHPLPLIVVSMGKAAFQDNLWS
jgi:hypothetical protein